MAEASLLKRPAICDPIDEEPSSKRTMMLCCICGISMEANPTAQCANCLKTTVDIADVLPRSVVLPHCRECDRYLGDSRWMLCERESRDLLALCLKKIKGGFFFFTAARF